jgi:cystathionine beta-lyase
MIYDFDQEVSRAGTNSIKWEFNVQDGRPVQWRETDPALGHERVLPMWVADLDFPCPQPVVDALVRRAQHGIFGYAAPTDTYYAAVVNWMERRHGWQITREWICTTPGVVPALNVLVRTFVAPGQKVLIQPPVYHPFYTVITNNAAVVAGNPLVLENGRYRMDFEDLDAKLGDPDVKLAILCHPHNPVGRVWKEDELRRFGDLCLEHSVLVVADEIHGDLILSGQVFAPFASLSEIFAHNSITCTAPSKTFNLAGLSTSNIIIPNDELRNRFQQALLTSGLPWLSPFGIAALEAAYSHGEAWLTQVIAYLDANVDVLEEYLRRHLPQLSLIRPQGTYLAWLDCRGLGLDGERLKHLMLQEAKVFVEEGDIFGQEGKGFLRMNIACPRSILTEALGRIKVADEQLGHQSGSRAV